MKRTYSLLLLIASLVLASCSGQSVEKSDPVISKSDYNFTMYDSNNVRVAVGLFEIENLSSTESSGKYSFTKVITEFEGYGNMKGGKFTGKINNKEKMMLVNTNPGQADRNVFFNLNIKKNPVEGTWYFTGFRNNSKPGKVKLNKISSQN